MQDMHVIVDCAKNRRSTGVYSAAELAYILCENVGYRCNDEATHFHRHALLLLRFICTWTFEPVLYIKRVGCK
jgi:hypothetical protein